MVRAAIAFQVVTTAGSAGWVAVAGGTAMTEAASPAAATAEKAGSVMRTGNSFSRSRATCAEATGALQEGASGSKPFPSVLTPPPGLVKHQTLVLLESRSSSTASAGTRCESGAV